MQSCLFSTQTALVLAILGVALTAGPAISQTVGKAAAVNPAATSSSGRTLTLGSDIIHKERVRTSAAGSLQLLFIDRTTLNIGPNSDVLIDEYVFDPNTNTGKMSVSLGKGLMRFVGGQISHSGNAQVKTPTATIGIRGAVGSFSYDPRTKITSASNDCSACVLTLLAPNGQTIQIPPGNTATVQGDGSVKIATTTKQDTERNIRATHSKGNQKGGASGNTSQHAGSLGNKPIQPGSAPSGSGAGSQTSDLEKTRQTTTGNAGANFNQPRCGNANHGCF